MREKLNYSGDDWHDLDLEDYVDRRMTTLPELDSALANAKDGIKHGIMSLRQDNISSEELGHIVTFTNEHLEAIPGVHWCIAAPEKGADKERFLDDRERFVREKERFRKPIKFDIEEARIIRVRRGNALEEGPGIDFEQRLSGIITPAPLLVAVPTVYRLRPVTVLNKQEMYFFDSV